MELSAGSLIGAAIGLAGAVVEWRLVLPMLEDKLREGAAARGEEPGEAERRMGVVRLGFGLSALALPLVGFVMGSFVGAP